MTFWRRALHAVAALLGRPPQVADAAEAAAPGRTLAGYRIEREIARGAMGALYAAVDPRDDKTVALKTLALARELEPADVADARERLLAEVAAASRLRHPDIVAVHGGGVADGVVCIVMDLLSGTDLTRYTRPARLLPEPVVLRIVARVADALDHAHRHGVVHRDVKPANVMVDLVAHRVTVTDFGIARYADGARTRSGVMLGTPSYMSPEQLAGGAVDGRSDLYALGVLLYQLLTGELPHDATSLGRLLQQIAAGAPRDPRQLKPHLPDDLVALMQCLLAKSPADRPPDGATVAAELRRIEAAAAQAPPPNRGR